MLLEFAAQTLGWLWRGVLAAHAGSAGWRWLRELVVAMRLVPACGKCVLVLATHTGGGYACRFCGWLWLRVRVAVLYNLAGNEVAIIKGDNRWI